MNKKDENRNVFIAGLITALLVIWLIMSAGCATPTQRRLEKPGHWPGWIVEPQPPVHEQANQIELRNAYSDGWQDRGEAIDYER